MTDRLKVHALDSAGATDGQVPSYDATLGRVVWADGGSGMGTPPYDYNNGAASGVTTISASPSTTETIIAGMDTSALTAGVAADVTINLWEAMNQSGVTKGSVARLRDGGLTGTVLASHTFTDAGDSTAGHQQQWSYSGTVTPATTRLCVTIQATAGTPQITSDTRIFTVHQDAISGIMLDGLNDVDTTTTPPSDGDALLYDAALSLWVPGAPAGGGGGATVLDDLTDVDTTTTPPTTGQVLKFNGTVWVPAADSTGAGGGGSGYPPGSADTKPVAPNAKDDEFDGTSTVTWTNTPSVANTWNVNSDRADHLHLRAAGTASAYVGKTQPIPAAFPFTIKTKLVSTTSRANNHRGGGILLAPSGYGSGTTILYLGEVWNAGLAIQRVRAQAGGTFVDQNSTFYLGAGPWYFRATVTSATSVNFDVSNDGYAWINLVAAYNPGFSIALMGLAMSEEGAGGGCDAYFDFFRVS